MKLEMVNEKVKTLCTVLKEYRELQGMSRERLLEIAMEQELEFGDKAFERLENAENMEHFVKKLSMIILYIELFRIPSSKIIGGVCADIEMKNTKLLEEIRKLILE